MWEIKYYQDKAGNYPVKEFIETLDIKARAKVARTIDLLEEFGINLSMPYAEHIEGKLWELRTRVVNNNYRILYFLNTGKAFIMLHGFIKKTGKISKKELEIARKRMADFES